MEPENLNALFFGVIGFSACWLLFRWLYGKPEEEMDESVKTDVAVLIRSVAALTVHVANMGRETGDAITSLVADEKDHAKRIAAMEKSNEEC